MLRAKKFARTAAFLAVVVSVGFCFAEPVLGQTPQPPLEVGERIAEEARKLLGTAPYASDPENCGQNPCTGYLVCTDVVAVAAENAGVGISEDPCACSLMRRAEEQRKFFKGESVAGANNSLSRHYEPLGSPNPPEVGNVLLYRAHVAVVVGVESIGEGQLTLKTVEANGGPVAVNINSREYSLAQRDGGWYFTGGKNYTTILGWGVIDEEAPGSPSDHRRIVAPPSQIEVPFPEGDWRNWLGGPALAIAIGLIFLLWFVKLLVENRKFRKKLRQAGIEFGWRPSRRFKGWFFLLGVVLSVIWFMTRDSLIGEMALISLGMWVFFSLGWLWEKIRPVWPGWPSPLLPWWLRDWTILLGSTILLAYLMGIIIGLGFHIQAMPSVVRETPVAVEPNAVAIIKAAAAEEPDCDCSLVYAIWETETHVANCQSYRNQPGKNPCRSYAGAEGPFQFMDGTWSAYADVGWDKWDLHDASRVCCRMTTKLGLQQETTRRGFQLNFTGLDGSLCWNCANREGDDAWKQAGVVWDRWQGLKALERRRRN